MIRPSTLLFTLSLALFTCGKKEEPTTTTVLNLIQIENQKPGTTDWLIKVPERECEYPDHQFCRREQIEGYCSATSVRAGDSLHIYVSTNPATQYTLDIFRMGYYGGKGGRLMKSYTLQGTSQSTPAADPKTNFLECEWDAAVSFVVPDDWVSGVYLGKMTTATDSSQAYVVFIVRDDRQADFFFQCSDLTWQAHNRWPQWHSMYDEGQQPWVNTNGARISFDRPYALYVNDLPSDFNPLSNGGGEFLLWEFPLAFWMEKEGYDVTYISNIDTHADGKGLLRGKAFLSVGHDEYWTHDMFNNVMAARDAGVNLLFLSGNSVDGTVYLEPSTDGRPNRVTGRLPEREFRKEQDLMGSTSYGVGYTSFVVKQPDHWMFEGTGMKLNDSIPDLIGWEYHGIPTGNMDGLVVVAQNTIPPNQFTSDSPADHAATFYTTPKGNFVFNAGTCFWSIPLSTPPGYQQPVCNLGQNGYRVIDYTETDRERVRRITKNNEEFVGQGE
ncbi:MAG: hypothetical protein DIU61_007170 [Bacteroidota bacterium]|jgi:hypothetical protein